MPKKEAPRPRYSNPAGDSKFPKKRFDGPSAPSKPAAPQPIVEHEASLTWDIQPTFVSTEKPVGLEVNVEKEVKEERPLAKEVKEVKEENLTPDVAVKTESTPVPKKFASINSGKQREPRERPHGKKSTFDMKTLESSLMPEAAAAEEEAVVLLPNIRRHLAPEIEPSPVLLPVSVKSCGNIKFGQSAAASSQQILFGEQSGKLSVGAGSEENVASAANQPSYTTTSIDALPSPIGSPTSPFAAQEQTQQQEPSPFTSSPPGLSANANAAGNTMGGYYQNPRFPSHQQHRSAAPLGFDQMESPRAPYPHYSHHHRQAYDPYGQQQLGSHQSRYEVPFNSRYAGPYGGAVQPSIEDSFVGSSNYYGGAGRGQSNSYYPASSSSSSYAQQQMMYGGGSESYAVGSATSNFTPASARYQPSANPNPNSSYGSAQPHHHHHHHQQQQQQQHQQHYSYSAGSSAQQASAAAAFPGNPVNRSPSRMF